MTQSNQTSWQAKILKAAVLFILVIVPYLALVGLFYPLLLSVKADPSLLPALLPHLVWAFFFLCLLLSLWMGFILWHLSRHTQLDDDLVRRLEKLKESGILAASSLNQYDIQIMRIMLGQEKPIKDRGGETY